MPRVKFCILLILITTSLAFPGIVQAGRAPQTGPVGVTVTINSVSPEPSFVNQTVTVEVTAVDQNGAVPPGNVSLITRNNATLCSISLNTSGVGSCDLTFSTPGSVPMRAFYPGATGYLASFSAEVFHVIQARFATSVTITAHAPFPSYVNEDVSVQASVTSAGPLPVGTLSIYAGDASCAAPTPGLSVPCTTTLAGGSGACLLPLLQAGTATICAAYSGDVANLPSVGQVTHLVSAGNTALSIESVVPSPSVLNQPVQVNFALRSTAGTPPPGGIVTITSGAEQCSATLAVGRCNITLRQPHLQPITAAYPGEGVFSPATSNTWMQRVNAPPTSLGLSNQQVDAFLPVGATVGSFTTLDPNPDETHTYTLVVGAGSTGNSYFEIVGSQLVLRRALPSNGGSLSIRVRSVDPAGLSREATFIITIDTGELPQTGFAPASITRLPDQPVDEPYRRLDALTISIPRLNVTANVVGVPIGSDGWNAAWLGRDFGWLDGTAFPTWQGNSVLVGHNFLADGSEGPLLHLSSMRYGDTITVQAFGTISVYEVRAVQRVNPDDASVLRHEEQAWLTLITCQDFDEKLHSYRARVVVKAVLVAVNNQPETPH